MAYVKTQCFRRKDQFGYDVEVSFMAEAGRITWIRVCTYLPFTDNKLRSDYYKKEDPELFEFVRKREERYLQKHKSIQVLELTDHEAQSPASDPIPTTEPAPVTKSPKPVKEETAPEYFARILKGVQ